MFLSLVGIFVLFSITAGFVLLKSEGCKYLVVYIWGHIALPVLQNLPKKVSRKQLGTSCQKKAEEP